MRRLPLEAALRGHPRCGGVQRRGGRETGLGDADIAGLRVGPRLLARLVGTLRARLRLVRVVDSRYGAEIDGVVMVAADMSVAVEEGAVDEPVEMPQGTETRAPREESDRRQRGEAWVGREKSSSMHEPVRAADVIEPARASKACCRVTNTSGPTPGPVYSRAMSTVRSGC